MEYTFKIKNLEIVGYLKVFDKPDKKIYFLQNNIPIK